MMSRVYPVQSPGPVGLRPGDVYHHPNGARVVVDDAWEGVVRGWSVPPGADLACRGFDATLWRAEDFQRLLVEQGWSLTPTTIDEEVPA